MRQLNTIITLINCKQETEKRGIEFSSSHLLINEQININPVSKYKLFQ